MEQTIERARALFRDGRFVDVIAALGDPGASADGWTLRGEACAELGLRKEALACWRRARQLAPERRDLALRLAAELPDEGDLSDAELSGLLPGFSLPAAMNLPARRFLDLAGAPHLSTVYANDNLIAFQRALTFLRDPVFMGAVGRASEGEHTFADRTWRAHVLVWAAKCALKLKGDFVELGTFRGFFASCLVGALDFAREPRRLYLYDTFEGLPDDSVREDVADSFYEGLKAHYSEPDIHDSVRARFAAARNVRIVRGKVPDTLRETCPTRIAFLHVDLNSANHEVAALEFLWDRLAPGAFILLDDHGFAVFEKQTAAHQAFFAAKDLPIAELPTGQGLVIKLA